MIDSICNYSILQIVIKSSTIILVSSADPANEDVNDTN